MQDNYKAAGIVAMRDMFQSGPVALQQAMLASLSDEERICYQTVMPVSWISLDQGMELIRKGSIVLFPEHEKPARELNRHLAHVHLKGLYQMLVQVLDVQTILSIGTKLWRTYHKKGKAFFYQGKSSQEGVYIIEGYPELPEFFRDTLIGYLIGALEVGGASTIQVSGDFSDPLAWRWNGSWEEVSK